MNPEPKLFASAQTATSRAPLTSARFASKTQPIRARYERTMLSLPGLGRRTASGALARATRSFVDIESNTPTSSRVADPSVTGSNASRMRRPAGPILYRASSRHRPAAAGICLAASASCGSNHWTGDQSPSRTRSSAHSHTLPISSNRRLRIAATTSVTASAVLGKRRRFKKTVGKTLKRAPPPPPPLPLRKFPACRVAQSAGTR